MSNLDKLKKTKEYKRLFEPFSENVQPWKFWGPYISERSWGTVREDYSHDGSAWNYLPHDLARSKAYRWGEDGIAGFSSRYQTLCFCLGLWNGHDPILKERLFGLDHDEGNHGEDVKEYYYYLDGLPTHTYMKYLYKYPQTEFPYHQLIAENKRRQSQKSLGEFELIDTKVFDDNRYFDVFIEYAKADTDDICIRVQAFNRGPEKSTLHIIPQLWFRNTWSWGEEPDPEPLIEEVSDGQQDVICIIADDSTAKPMPNLIFEYRLGKRYFYGPPKGVSLFTNNETHMERVVSPEIKSRSPFVKDAFHRYIINKEQCINPEKKGTKCGLHYTVDIEPSKSETLLFRFSNIPLDHPLDSIEERFSKRIRETNEFYDAIHPENATKEERMIQRQAFAGMLWNKQTYLFDVNLWLNGDNPKNPPDPHRKFIRNKNWRHLNSMRVMSMPDTWEYPWFAAWDLAFQSVTFSLIDIEFAKSQLLMLLFEQFQHPNGQIPAYEWEFSDLNPPVHAWAVLEVYHMEKKKWGSTDTIFLKKCFHKLLINFAFWVNIEDSSGKNIFEGGFLGLDNITIIDRSEKLLNHLQLQQSDATGWMAMFCLNLMHIAIELSQTDPAYEKLGTKFLEHYVYVAAAMKKVGGSDYEFWSEKDGFFYDVLCAQNSYQKIRVRSIVGIIPLFAIGVLNQKEISLLPEFSNDITWFFQNRHTLTQACITKIDSSNGTNYLCTIMSPEQAYRIIERVRDPNEFFSPHGVRSVSKYHAKHPFSLNGVTLGYEPGEGLGNLKGGNSNWRGPVWFPINYMLVQTLEKLDINLGKTTNFPVSFHQTAEELANNLISLFKVDDKGNRPIYDNQIKFQTDPYWKDYILFFEYYHGDTGKGLGASHQTGWSGLVANLIDEWRK